MASPPAGFDRLWHANLKKCTVRAINISLVAMNPGKVDRTRVVALTDLPNIGKACAEDLRLLGIHKPGQLVGRCPFEMYETLCEKTASRQDPCVIDVFMSVTRFMSGEEPRPWWAYTQERKQLLRQKAGTGEIRLPVKNQKVSA